MHCSPSAVVESSAGIVWRCGQTHCRFGIAPDMAKHSAFVVIVVVPVGGWVVVPVLLIVELFRPNSSNICCDWSNVQDRRVEREQFSFLVDQLLMDLHNGWSCVAPFNLF